MKIISKDETKDGKQLVGKYYNIVGRMTELHNDRKSIRIIGVYPEITGLSTEIQTKYQNM